MMEHIAAIAQRFIPKASGKPVTMASGQTYAPPERATLHQLDAKVHPSVALAVQAARKWQTRAREYANASLILVASAVKDDINRTGYGCGKTHIARSICWSQCLMLDDVPMAPLGKLYAAADVLGLLSEGGEHEIKALIGSAPILAIDDIGAEGEIPFVSASRQEQERQARYYRIINYCYERGVSVVITANLTIPQLAAHVGGRCWSRLMEMAPTGFVIDMTGCPDYRRKAGGR